ncbi:MAG TPA: transposase [Actinomycetota bacterium]|nr:transposase [Actinomycetota bacterium]
MVSTSPAGRCSSGWPLSSPSPADLNRRHPCRSGRERGPNACRHRRIPATPRHARWRNGYIGSFNSRVRVECLNINMFWSLAQARVVISDWKEDYNHRRRHGAPGYQAPARGRRWRR